VRPRSPWIYAGLAAGIVSLAAMAKLAVGRSPWGLSGSPGLWFGDVWGPENSQRLADPYTFTHVLHGVGFHGLLRVVAAAQPVAVRAVVAVILESAWEVFENSDTVIEW
jgi:hypothetical protein